MILRSRSLAIAGALSLIGWSGVTALAQQSASQPSAPTASAAQDDERRAVLSSDRWRQAEANFEKWLAVQQIYSPAEAAALKDDLAQRAATLSPAELAKLLSDLESRLAVLLSPQADEARRWLAELTAVARNPEAHVGGPLPDVANMSAEEIREALDRFHDRRTAQRQSQTAFNRARQRQVQGAHNVQASRRSARPGVGSRPGPQIGNAAPGASPSQYAPRQQERTRRRPVYRIGPFGEPIYWDPLDYQRRPWVERW